MKKTSFLASFLLTAFFVLSAALCSAQDSIAYQLVIRNSAGELVTNKQVNMRFALLKGDSVCYEETMPTKTDKYGNISVMVGTGKATKGAMKDVPWSTMDISLKVETDVNGGENFAVLGTVPFAASPYAMYAATAGSNANNGAPKDGEALFEVCDRDGKPVFAVYNDGIVVYVDENGNKAKRSGFVVTGRNVTKDGEAANYFAVDAEGTHVFVNDAENSDKAPRSGFVVTGRKVAKSATTDNEPLADNRTATKADGADMFTVTGSLTTVYVDDAEGDDKAPRSGFVVTGRKVANKDGGNIIDIDGERTNLSTTTLSIANNNNQGNEEAPAPVAALQLTNENVTMNTDFAFEGDVRPVLNVEENDEFAFNIYLSDEERMIYPNEGGGHKSGYDYENNTGRFYFSLYSLFDDYDESDAFVSKYNRIASFRDEQIIPLKNDDAILLINRKGEETAVVEDAVVLVYGMRSSLNVWPLTALDNFEFSFALTDFKQNLSFISGGGSASDYVRFNVTLSSEGAYNGCELMVKNSPVPYTLKLTTPYGDVNRDIYYSYTERTSYGSKYTLEVVDMPMDKIFSHWMVNGRRFYGKQLNLTISELYMEVSAVFKNESETIYVDGNISQEEVQDGTSNKPFSTIAAALKYISDNTDSDKGFCILVKNIPQTAPQEILIGKIFNDNAKYITIESNQIGSYFYIYQLTDTTTVPVIIRYAQLEPKVYNGPDVVTVAADNAQLTLENCEICGSDYGEETRTMHGAVVSAGELVLIGGGVSTFEKQNGILVKTNATLTLKNECDIRYNGLYNENKTGGAVYLESGATLNAYSCTMWSNKGYSTYSHHTPGYAGASVYAAGPVNFNVGADADIEGVGLAKGAYITAIGEFPKMRNEENHGPYYEELDPVVYFDSIADPTDVVVKLGEGTETSRPSDIFSRFVIDNESTAELGYLSTIGLEGKPVKSNEAYSKSDNEIYLYFSNGMACFKYTYFRAENNNEHLHLEYNFNESNYEYHNFWLVDNTIYRDTIYANDGNGHNLPIYAYENGFFMDYTWNNIWKENYAVDRESDSYGLFKVDTEDLRTQYTVEKSETEVGVNIYYDGNGNEVLRTKNDFVISVQDPTAFKNYLGAFIRLLEQSISIAGKDLDFNDLEEISWNPSETRFGERVPYFEKDGVRSYSLSEVEERFEKLRTGFDVSISALGGKAIITNSNEEIRGFVTKTVPFDGMVTLTAVPDNNATFAGWSDGAPATENPHIFTIRGDGDIYPIFRYNDNDKDLYVSANGTANGNGSSALFGSSGNPFNSVTLAGVAIERGCDNNSHATIHVNGEIAGEQTLSSKIKVRALNIEGSSNETDILNGGNHNAEYEYWYYGSSPNESVLSINTTSPITISNLKITGGYAYNGGGIYCAAGSNVTLTDGVLVAKNAAVKNYSEAETTGRGGGIYNAGTLSIKGTAQIGTEDHPNKAFYGGGVFNAEGGTFSINGSAYVPVCETEYSNDVYLCGNSYITIAGPLTPPDEANGVVAAITPTTYYCTTTLLKLAKGSNNKPITSTTIAAEYEKFVLTQPDDGYTYSVSSTGKIISWWMIKEGNHYYVDLGEGGKWATTNMGASSPEEYGSYYSWGATSRYTYSVYTSSVYTNAAYPSDGILPLSGQLGVDAAYNIWGSNWYMPTSSELYALYYKCHFEWTTNYSGKSGYIFYKTKSSGTYTLSDPHIFLPAAGYYYSSDVNTEAALSSSGSKGEYWSASCDIDNPTDTKRGEAYILSFSSNSINTISNGNRNFRYLGKTIRPIWRPSK